MTPGSRKAGSPCAPAPLLEPLEPRCLLSVTGSLDLPAPIESNAGVSGAGDLVVVDPVGIDTSGTVQKPIRSLSLQFSANVQATLTVGQLLLHNDTTGADVRPQDMALEYDAGANLGVWRFPGLPGGVLAGGLISARLLAEGIADESGTPLDGDGDGSAGGDREFSFVVTVAGDADLNGTVDRDDLQLIKGHFGGGGGAAWGDGDFNDDGKVDALDYVAFKRGYGIRVVPNRAPVFATPLADKYVIVPGGGGLTIGLDGYDVDGDAMTITAVSDDGRLTALVVTGNRYARLHFVRSDGATAIGDIVVQLFEGRSGSATDRFITLATNHVNSDGTLDPAGIPFYTDVPVHRVIDDFMIQTGDAQKGDGSGGSPLGAFPDDFDEVLSFIGRGVLALANAGPNTNDCQFFLTEVPTTWLDQRHMIFGQIISGWDVLETISEMPTDANDRPLEVPLLDYVDIFDSDQDATVTLLAAPASASDCHVTITLDDGKGGVTQQVITISAQVRIDAPAQVAAVPGESTTFTPEIAHTSEGEVDVWVRATAAEMAGRVTIEPQTYQVTLDVPVDITVSSFMVEISAIEVGYDNATVISQGVTVLTAGALPVIGEIGDLFLAPGETRKIAASITDDGARSLDVSIATSHVGLQGSLDPVTHEITLVAPTAVTGVFAVTVSAVESGFVDRDPVTRVFYVFVQGAADPTPLGRLATAPDGYAQAVARVGDRMYVAEGPAGVEVFDVSEPATPVLLGSYAAAGESRDVLATETVLDGRNAIVVYVAALYEGLLVLDATDPAAITELAAFPLGDGAAVNLSLDGDLLYVANWTGGVCIFDVSDAADVHLVNTVKQFSSPDFSISYAASVAVSGGYAYVVDAMGGFVIVNVSDPANVEFVDAWGTGSNPWDVAIRGDVLYVLDQTNGIIVLDVHSPAEGVLLGYKPMALMAWTSLDVSGDLAVVASQAGYVFVDVSDPAHMTQGYVFTAPEWGLGPTFFGSVLALPLGQHGVVLLDVSGL